MSFRNTAFTVIVSSLCACAAASADEPRSTLTNAPSGTRVLLFRSGRAIEGEIAETDTHYVVVRPVGKVEILKSDIELVAGDLDEVYRYKLERMNDRDPEEHIRLAQWCLVVNLRERAIEELERSVELAPDSIRAKGLLESLRRTPKSGNKAAQTPAGQEQPAPESAPPARTYPSFQKEVSSAHVSTFSVQIQPMLLRSCGTAGCHDTNHSGSLVLQGSSRAAQRTSQQNLRSVLTQIDTEEPELSPLLLESLRAHGTARRSPFVSGTNDPAYAKLADWVRAVAGKPAAKSTPTTPTADPSASTVEHTKDNPKVTGKETSPPNLVYSNKPIAQTPARRRAGMTPTNSPTDSTAARPASKKNDSPIESPAEADRITEKSPSSPPESKSVTANPDFKPPATDRATDLKPPAKPGDADRSPPDRFQPVDPFDPEKFNRQFAPR